MRKIVSGLFISVDGVTESPNLWQYDLFDDDMGAAIDTQIQAQDTILLGRVTYQEWSAYWPASDEPGFADYMNLTPKVVFSTTLDEVAWADFERPRLVKDDAAQAVRDLKRGEGKDIGVGGSPTLVRWLLQNDLLDELLLMVHPVVAGKGKRLFDGEGDLKRLDLVQSKMTGTGVAILTYRPRRP